MNWKDKAILFFATGAGAGYLPKAPGTFGTVVALPICYVLSAAGWFYAIPAILALVLLSVWIAGKAEKMIQQKDPGCIVIDEMAGMTVTLAGLPFHLIPVVVGFIVFRVLDIVKPVPIRTVEKKLSGGTGIVADDIIAGAMANVIVRILLFVIES
jgi:phosphatidylglycerophosphatase A